MNSVHDGGLLSKKAGFTLYQAANRLQTMVILRLAMCFYIISIDLICAS